MSSAPCATTPVLATAGSPAVTGADRPLRVAQGNGAAVDFRGAVTKSEGVVWGQVLARLRVRTQLGAVAPIRTKGHHDRLPATARRRSPRIQGSLEEDHAAADGPNAPARHAPPRLPAPDTDQRRPRVETAVIALHRRIQKRGAQARPARVNRLSALWWTERYPISACAAQKAPLSTLRPHKAKPRSPGSP